MSDDDGDGASGDCRLGCTTTTTTEPTPVTVPRGAWRCAMEPPTLPAASLAFSRAEDDARVDGGVAVGALDARDPDVGQTATLSYELSGADAAHFEVAKASI